MDASHIREFVAADHEVGARTVTHPKLSRLEPGELAREVRESKSVLEDLLGCEVISFAYPKGDYNPAVRSIVEKAGFSLACTTHEAHLTVRPDWLTLPRVSVLGPTTSLQFQAKLSQGLAVYERLRGR